MNPDQGLEQLNRSEGNKVILVAVALIVATASAYIILGLNVLEMIVTVVFIVALFLGSLTIRKEFLLYFLILSIMFFSGMERGQIVPSLKLNEVILIGVSLILILRLALSGKTSLVSKAITIIDLLFILILVGRGILPIVVSFLRNDLFDTRDLIVTFGFVQLFIVYRLVLATVKDVLIARRVIFILLISSITISFIAILQSADLFGVRQILSNLKIGGGGEYASIEKQTYYLNRGRAFSVFGSWNTLGSYLAIHLVISLVFFKYLPSSEFSRRLLVLAFILNFTGLLASGSYTGFVIFLLGLGIVLLVGRGFQFRKRLNKRIILYLIILIIVSVSLAAVLFGQNLQKRISLQSRDSDRSWIPASLTTRIELWKSTFIPVIMAEPGSLILGLGPKALGIEENYYLYLLFRFGLPGLVAYLIFILTILKISKYYFNHGEGFIKATSLSVFIIVIQLSVASLTARYFDYSGVMETLWILLGLLVFLVRTPGRVRQNAIQPS